MTPELVAAAERMFKWSQGKLGTTMPHPVKQAVEDAYDVSRHIINESERHRDDATPLSELSDEQWLGLGFERYPATNGFWHRELGARTFLATGHRPFLCRTACDREITTLGQLRHLIAAIGKAQE